jgi:predicted DNA-binding transcriptional regulator AlpA
MRKRLQTDTAFALRKHRAMCNSLHMTIPSRLMGSTEACERLGIKRSTLTQWIGKRWIVPEEQLASGAYVFTRSEVERAAAVQGRAAAS